VFLSRERRGERLARDAARLLAELRQGRADPEAVGDSFVLEHRFDALPTSVISGQFGERFTAELGELPSGKWYGPIESGYGAHLVFIDERTEGRTATLEQASAQHVEASEKVYQALLRRYTVTIEPGPPADISGTAPSLPSMP
jgi:peptidyl-prolyl cis-trans isomerase C